MESGWSRPRELVAGTDYAKQLGAIQAAARINPTSNAVAAVASFCVPGLGQLAQGRVGAGIGLFVASCLLWFLALGWLVHIFAAFDCAAYKG